MTVDTKLIRSILNCKSCPSDMNEVLLNLLDEFDLVVKERDALRTENERLREALKYIVDRGYTGASYVAQQAMNEVTK